jgi:hypothetical protein
MSLHWSKPMLSTLLPDKLVARLKEPQNDPYKEPSDAEHFQTVDASLGELMRDIPAPGLSRVSRRKMRAFCAQDVDVKVVELAKLDTKMNSTATI